MTAILASLWHALGTPVAAAERSVCSGLMSGPYRLYAKSIAKVREGWSHTVVGTLKGDTGINVILYDLINNNNNNRRLVTLILINVCVLCFCTGTMVIHNLEITAMSNIIIN